MNKQERKALEAYTKRIEEAAMKFTVEIYKAGGDLFRQLDGEEIYGPSFLSHSEWQTKESQQRADKAKRTREQLTKQ